MENINTAITENPNLKMIKNQGITDFHTHILPGIDDGSKSIAESLEILSDLKSSGVGTVVFTPHFYPNETTLEVFLKKRNAAYESLLPHLDKFNMNFKLGAEVYYYSGISKSAGIAELKIEQTDYLLVEMPFYKWSEGMVNEIIELNNRADLCVVLAHIDRYLKFASKAQLEALNAHGVLFQVNINSFSSWLKALKLKSMISKNMINFFGSDVHNMTTRAAHWDDFKKLGIL